MSQELFEVSWLNNGAECDGEQPLSDENRRRICLLISCAVRYGATSLLSIRSLLFVDFLINCWLSNTHPLVDYGLILSTEP